MIVERDLPLVSIITPSLNQGRFIRDTIESILALPVDYDLVCYTPSEWEQMEYQPFWRYARKTELILYERR